MRGWYDCLKIAAGRDEGGWFVPARPRQSRNFKDRGLLVVFWVSGPLNGGRLPLVPAPPRLARVVGCQLFAMAPTREETDRTLRTEDGSIWTAQLRSRDSEADAARMARCQLTLLRRYPGRAVQTVLF